MNYHHNYDPTAEAIKRLSSWFRPLKAEQMSVLAAKLASIPAEPLKEIVEALIDDHPPGSAFPTVAKITGHWWAWQQNNPAKCAPARPRTRCHECGHGDDPAAPGFLWARRPKNGAQLTPGYGGPWVEYVYRCAICDNWRGQVADGLLPAATKQWLVDKGYQVFPWPDRGSCNVARKQAGR